MQYKVVPGPQAIEGNNAQAASLIESLINENATGGWKYHSMETMVTIEKKGCITKTYLEKKIYLLIFEREA